MNSVASVNLTSKQIDMQTCDQIEPTVHCNLLKANYVIAENNENPFELALLYQVAKEKARL